MLWKAGSFKIGNKGNMSSVLFMEGRLAMPRLAVTCRVCREETYIWLQEDEEYTSALTIDWRVLELTSSLLLNKL